MTEILLTESTGNATVDQVLRDTVDVFEAAFPGRVRGYYVEGSYAGATGVATSEVDLSIVFVDAFQDGEAARAWQLAEACRLLSAVELDIGMDDEAAWRAGLPPALKLAARLVYGTETRDRFPLVPLAAWTRDRMHTSYWRMVHLFGRPAMIAPPLGYPDPDDEFYGYLRRTVRLPDGREVPCTRDLIRLTGWAATGLLAWEAGVYVARKRLPSPLPPSYRRHLDRSARLNLRGVPHRLALSGARGPGAPAALAGDLCPNPGLREQFPGPLQNLPAGRARRHGPGRYPRGATGVAAHPLSGCRGRADAGCGSRRAHPRCG